MIAGVSDARRGRVLRALDYQFTVAVDGPTDLVGRVASLFDALPTGNGPVRSWLVQRATDADGWELVVDGVREVVASSADSLVGQLVLTLNRCALDAWSGVVCHAGGVSAGGRGIVLPADSESGKTTLTAGLVRRGFDYLSDEGVAFHPGENLIEPYPKPLSLDEGSWFLFPELEPGASLAGASSTEHQWQVAPDAIRPNAVGSPCPARLIVFPKYEADGATELVPLPRAEALVELAKNTFSFNSRARFALDELGHIVRDVACYRLRIGDLEDAVGRIERLVDQLPEPIRG